MKLIGTRLGLRGHDTGYGLAESCVIVLQRDFGFGYGIQVGIHYNNPEDGILVVSSIQFEGCTTEMLALSEDLQAALRILGGSVTPSHHLLRTRRHQLQVGKV